MFDEVRRELSRQCLIDVIRGHAWIPQIDLAQLKGSFFCLIYNLSQHPLCALVSSSIECDQSHRILNRFLILWLNKISINIVTAGSAGKESARQCRRHRRPSFDPWVEKFSWRKKQQPTLVFLPEKSHGQRSLVGSSLWGLRIRHDLVARQQQQTSSLIQNC